MMIRQILACFFLLASILWPFAACAQDLGALRETGRGRVIEVITPYTVQLDNGQIVRLSGVHFPDYTPENAGDLSVLAMEILKDMLTDENVTIYQTPRTDRGRENRMGHQIAHLQRQKDGLWVQGVLLSLGLAEVKTSQRNPEMAAPMLMLEREAREQKLGIWAEAGAILSPEDTPSHLNSFQIVEGRIESVALHKNRLYMNFGKDWRSDFTVSVGPEDLRYFSQSGLDPLQWGGRLVRVRGWLEEYNGPLIEIDHPEALEFPE